MNSALLFAEARRPQWVYRIERGVALIPDKLTIFLQAPAQAARSYASILRHLGAFGLFVLAILDSTPVPTFGGPDILTAILAARRGEPWYYYSAAATLGSVIGAYLTFHVSRAAGASYLGKKFGERRVDAILNSFKRWGTGALIFTTLVPIPSPTTSFFAAAGVLNYPLPRFLIVVASSRAARYFAIGAIAARHGHHFVQVFRHPGQYVGWLILIAGFVSFLVAAALYSHRRLNALQN